MQTTGQPSSRADWQTPLEADPADATEQALDLLHQADDPEASASGPRTGDLDLGSASEADLAEQLHEVPFDDDGDR